MLYQSTKMENNLRKTREEVEKIAFENILKLPVLQLGLLLDIREALEFLTKKK